MSIIWQPLSNSLLKPEKEKVAATGLCYKLLVGTASKTSHCNLPKKLNFVQYKAATKLSQGHKFSQKFLQSQPKHFHGNLSPQLP